ncbi:MAG TPA: HAD hydrolase-like protein [Vicinamibacteria bacterium]|jgi:phosphoglycolate phosphatase
MDILFDLDGTLTDSAPGITRCIQHALRHLGRDVPPDAALRACVGPPLTDTFARLTADEPRAANPDALLETMEELSAWVEARAEREVSDGTRRG